MRNAARPCPTGYCRNMLGYHRDAVCRSCFSRLPRDHRDKLIEHRRAQAWHLYSTASTDAVAWLNAHPPGSARRTGEAPG